VKKEEEEEEEEKKKAFVRFTHPTATTKATRCVHARWSSSSDRRLLTTRLQHSLSAW
jgi:hypothetical protein